MEILKPKAGGNTGDVVITSFYKFVQIHEGLELFRDKLEALCKKNEILGTVLMANEGVNGTVSGSPEAISQFYGFFQGYKEFQDITFKESYYIRKPFGKLKVKIKREVVSFDGGECRFNPGTYIEPELWDEFIARPDVVNIDTRNDYEYIIGTFKGALNPDTSNFREFKEWCVKNLPDKDQKIAGFCTGGVRCEKSTSWLKAEGYKNVYHLKGGILGYFLETRNKNKMWQGNCFVFDERVIVNDEMESI